MPQIRSKQVLGETPVRPNDITNKKYVDDLFASGGTGGGAINIEDEGILVFSGATILNFIGTDVRAQSEGGGTKRVNIYIPPPAYASHFDTSDGTTNASVSPVSTTTRYVALPDSPGVPYNIGTWGGGTTQPTIRNSVSNLTYSPAGLFSIYDLTTTFTATLYDAVGTVLATHTMTLTGNNTATVQNITLTVVGWVVDADRYQADINVSIALNTLLPQGGKFSVSLIHDNSSDGTYTFTQNDIFKDTETLTAGVTGALTIIEENPNIKQISGVYYYDLGSEWHVNLPNINNLNSRSYPTSQQTRIEDNDLIFSSTVLNANGENGDFVGGTWTQQHDTTSAEYDKLDWTTNQENQTSWNHSTGSINTPQATGTIYDWILVDTVNSTTYNYLIDTYQDSSLRNSEMFRTETNASYPRLESDLTTPWDETLKLPVADDGTGLQVLADRLVYPQYDFQPLNPYSGTTQPDYTTETGNKTYYRLFETDGNNASNGILRFWDHNLTEADLANIEFEINLNHGLGWHTLNLDYSSGVLQDGDGCRVDPGVYSLDINDSLRFTLGQLQVAPPAGTATYLYLKITFSSSASDKYIGGIDFNGDYWA